MSQPTNARTAAMEALIEAHATELKLPTVRRRFKALATKRPVSSRHRSPTSPRCWKSKQPSAPNAANAPGATTRGSRRSSTSTTSASPTTQDPAGHDRCLGGRLLDQRPRVGDLDRRLRDREDAPRHRPGDRGLPARKTRPRRTYRRSSRRARRCGYSAGASLMRVALRRARSSTASKSSLDLASIAHRGLQHDPAVNLADSPGQPRVFPVTRRWRATNPDRGR
jgi:hypothetical protein